MTTSAHPYDADYYKTHCGPLPYGRDTPEFVAFFGDVADRIVFGLRPKRVFDAGCAMGLLVEALWDRGTEAHGRDVSDYAIGQARPDMREFCAVGTVADPIEGAYDLVTSIEVLEHMPEGEALEAIASMARASDRILFSSSPDDHDEPTHCNVRPIRYWLDRFAAAGFAPVLDFDASFLTPHAYLLERVPGPPAPETLWSFATIVRQRVTLAEVRARASTLERGIREGEQARATLALREAELRARDDEIRAREERIDALKAEVRRLASLADRVTADVERRGRDAEHDAERIGELGDEVSTLRAQAILDRASIASLAEASERARLVRTDATLVLSEARKALVGRDVALARAREGRATSEAGARLLRLALAAERERALRHAPVVEDYARIERRRRSRVRRSLSRRLGGTAPTGYAVDLATDAADALVREIRGSGLFDGAGYLASHPDVAAAGIDPVVHYVASGMAEGRPPTAHFVEDEYLAENPDVRAAGLPAFLHFLRSGIVEGRRPSSSVSLGVVGQATEARRAAEAVEETGMFDPVYYAAVYDDVPGSALSPAEHYATHGWTEGRWPNAEFDPVAYLSDHPDVAAAGENPLVHYALKGIFEGRALRRHASALSPPASAPAPGTGVATARSMVNDYERPWTSLPAYLDESLGPTLTVLTDGLDPGRLFGGVGTALVVGAILARRQGMRLRVVTREEAPDPGALGMVLKAHGVEWTGPTDFAHLPIDTVRPLAFGSRDVVLTTSWWTTRAAVRAFGTDRILYVLQEDERMFYPFGDQRLRCVETLETPGVRTLVNTEALHEHLTQTLPAGFSDRAVPFTPAFPATAGVRRQGGGDRRRFFFYARPGHARNLWWRGLDVVDEAISRGVLDPARWEVHFVGGKVPDMVLARGVVPVVTAKLPWQDYADLLGTMDLGLCLMDTPHPSYPPIDLASAGAVVVTNAHGLKTDLGAWSENILVAPCTVDGLVEALARAVALVDDDAERESRFARQSIPTSWAEQLARPLDSLFG